jgi:hypothetical protein
LSSFTFRLSPESFSPPSSARTWGPGRTFAPRRRAPASHQIH